MPPRESVDEALAELAAAEEAVAEARRKLAVLKGPTHIDGVRDPDAPCAQFRLGEPAGSCTTDGHYVCDECVEMSACSACGERPMYCKCEEALQ